MGKRWLAAVLCLLLLGAWPARAEDGPADPEAESHDLLLAETLAVRLQSLHLVQGVGTLADGSTDFDLARPPKRVEALVMLVRVLGREAAALSGQWQHPFTDVPAWADPYVGYAYETGLTKGVGAASFDPDSAASLPMYLTFMLRALGHSDGPDGDFQYSAPEGPARECGILPDQVGRPGFWRADAVIISYAALGAKLADGSAQLAGRLLENGVFTQAELDQNFDPALLSAPRSAGPLRRAEGVRSFQFTIANVADDSGVTALWLSDGSDQGGNWQWTDQGWIPFTITQRALTATYTAETDIDFEQIADLKIRYEKAGGVCTAAFGCPIENGGRYWLDEEANMRGGALMTPKT